MTFRCFLKHCLRHKIKLVCTTYNTINKRVVFHTKFINIKLRKKKQNVIIKSFPFYDLFLGHLPWKIRKKKWSPKYFTNVPLTMYMSFLQFYSRVYQLKYVMSKAEKTSSTIGVFFLIEDKTLYYNTIEYRLQLLILYSPWSSSLDLFYSYNCKPDLSMYLY